MKKRLSIIALCLVVIMCFTALVACNLIGFGGNNGENGGNGNGGNSGGGNGGNVSECDHVDANSDNVCDKCYRDMGGTCI